MTIVRQDDDALDWHDIHEQLRQSLKLKEAPELVEQLESLRAHLRGDPLSLGPYLLDRKARRLTHTSAFNSACHDATVNVSSCRDSVVRGRAH